eukprot:s1301_g17.t1
MEGALRPPEGQPVAHVPPQGMPVGSTGGETSRPGEVSSGVLAIAAGSVGDEVVVSRPPGLAADTARAEQSRGVPGAPHVQFEEVPVVPFWSPARRAFESMEAMRDPHEWVESEMARPPGLVGGIHGERGPQSLVGGVRGERNPQGLVGGNHGGRAPQGAVGGIHGVGKHQGEVVGQVGTQPQVEEAWEATEE